MFRLKLTLLYFFTLVLVVAVMWVFIDQKRDAYVQEQLMPGLNSAANSFVYVSDHRMQQLKEYADNLLKSDLSVYVELLNKNRDNIRKIRSRTRQEFPARQAVPPERIIDFVDKESKPILDEFEKDIEAKVTIKPTIEGGYTTYMRDIFSSCMAEADPWPVCYFKLTYLPLTRIIFPRQKGDLGEAFPELFILVDDAGSSRLLFDSLDTSVDQLQKEDLFMAGVRYKDHIFDNFDQNAPVLKEVKSSFDPAISSVIALNESRIFAIVARRIVDKEGAYLGALIVGYELENGMAWKDTAVALGIRPVLESCIAASKGAGEGAPASEKLCEYEMSRQENGVTYLMKTKKGQTIRGGTSLPEGRAIAVAKLGKDIISHPIYYSDELMAKSVVMALDYIPEGVQVQAVLTVDIPAAVNMFGTMKLILAIMGVILFIIGIIVIQILLRSFTRPFEEIDKGIHEVIGGNFEYSFPFVHFKEELARSMAQSLSVMKCVLLGLPLPEDAERDDSWADNLRIAGEGIKPAGPPLGGAGDSGPAHTPTHVTPDEIEEIKSADFKESATDYFQRLFKEYVAAKQALGEDTANITYIKFVEKIAKTEKSLREKYDTKQVIFKVETKDKQVVLVPLKVVE